MKDISEIMREAVKAADEAGRAWLTNALDRRTPTAFDVIDSSTGKRVGTLLDNCGSAYLKFKDRRRKEYRAFKAAGFILNDRTGTISIDYFYHRRHEHSLHVCCLSAALVSLQENGITGLSLVDYID